MRRTLTALLFILAAPAAAMAQDPTAEATAAPRLGRSAGQGELAPLRRRPSARPERRHAPGRRQRRGRHDQGCGGQADQPAAGALLRHQRRAAVRPGSRHRPLSHRAETTLCQGLQRPRPAAAVLAVRAGQQPGAGHLDPAQLPSLQPDDPEPADRRGHELGASAATSPSWPTRTSGSASTSGTTGNKESFGLPVAAYFRASENIAPVLYTGLGQTSLDGYGDSYTVPVGMGVLVGVNTTFDVGARFDFLNLLGANSSRPTPARSPSG